MRTEDRCTKDQAAAQVEKTEEPGVLLDICMHTVVRRGDRLERRVVVAVAAAQLMDFRTVDAKTIQSKSIAWYFSNVCDGILFVEGFKHFRMTASVSIRIIRRETN